MKYAKYAWVGNRISEEDMGALYRMKVKLRKPITVMVAEAVSMYVRARVRDEAELPHPSTLDAGKKEVR